MLEYGIICGEKASASPVLLSGVNTHSPLWMRHCEIYHSLNWFLWIVRHASLKVPHARGLSYKAVFNLMDIFLAVLLEGTMSVCTSKILLLLLFDMQWWSGSAVFKNVKGGGLKIRNYVSGFKSNQPENARFLSVFSSVVSLNVEMADWLDSNEQKYPSVFVLILLGGFWMCLLWSGLLPSLLLNKYIQSCYILNALEFHVKIILIPLHFSLIVTSL